MTTLSPIIFITTPHTKIMTSQILSEVDAGRFGNAFAFCTILIVIVMAVIGLMNLLVQDTSNQVPGSNRYLNPDPERPTSMNSTGSGSATMTDAVEEVLVREDVEETGHLQLVDLVKVFSDGGNDVRAVDGVNLDIAPGSSSPCWVRRGAGRPRRCG